MLLKGKNPLSLVRYLSEKNFDRWIVGYGKQRFEERMTKTHKGKRHLLFALCDHYEPLWGSNVPFDVGDRRVLAWEEGYPRLAKQFHDANGYNPRYSFFFPGEEYHPSYLGRLANVAKDGYGEVELHLHHDNDTSENLRKTLNEYLGLFAEHGHISRDRDGGYRYAFIHGNWCLANGRPDGRWCGVDDEVPLLFETGCYADFTFPAAPDNSQPNIVNQIYWPTGDLSKRRCYENGRRARVGEFLDDRLLMIQGPLALSLRASSVPIRIENTHLTDVDPPTASRVKCWVDQNIHVQGRPEWVFVKVHTHGASEAVAASLLGDGGAAMYRSLTEQYNDGENWDLHFVTAREMYNVAVAAMDGKSGNPSEYRDYRISPPPIAQK